MRMWRRSLSLSRSDALTVRGQVTIYRYRYLRDRRRGSAVCAFGYLAVGQEDTIFPAAITLFGGLNKYGHLSSISLRSLPFGGEYLARRLLHRRIGE
jgi:hypothetical protein